MLNGYGVYHCLSTLPVQAGYLPGSWDFRIRSILRRRVRSAGEHQTPVAAISCDLSFAVYPFRLCFSFENPNRRTCAVRQNAGVLPDNGGSSSENVARGPGSLLQPLVAGRGNSLWNGSTKERRTHCFYRVFTTLRQLNNSYSLPSMERRAELKTNNSSGGSSHGGRCCWPDHSG